MGKRSAQLTLHGWGSCEDLVKMGECYLAVVISLGLTIYLVMFPKTYLPRFCAALYIEWRSA